MDPEEETPRSGPQRCERQASDSYLECDFFSYRSPSTQRQPGPGPTFLSALVNDSQALFFLFSKNRRRSPLHSRVSFEVWYALCPVLEKRPVALNPFFTWLRLFPLLSLSSELLSERALLKASNSLS